MREQNGGTGWDYRCLQDSAWRQVESLCVGGGAYGAQAPAGAEANSKRAMSTWSAQRWSAECTATQARDHNRHQRAKCTGPGKTAWRAAQPHTPTHNIGTPAHLSPPAVPKPPQAPALPPLPRIPPPQHRSRVAQRRARPLVRLGLRLHAGAPRGARAALAGVAVPHRRRWRAARR